MWYICVCGSIRVAQLTVPVICVLKMTDFIDSLLTSMSSKFNEQKEVGPINLNEDKTLKWRGLHNNQYASVKKRRKVPATNAVDTPENGNNASATATAAADIAAATPSDKITGKDANEEGFVDDTSNFTETKSNRRILRRKLIDGMPDGANKRSSSRNNKKKQTSQVAAVMVANVQGAPDKVDKVADDTSSVIDSKVAGRRSIRIRKSTNSGDQMGQSDLAIAGSEQNKAMKFKFNDGIGTEVDLTEQKNIEQPKLRRSERTLHGLTSNDAKDISGVEEIKVESENSSSKPSSAVADVGNTEISKKLRRKIADEKKAHIETSIAATITADVIVVDDEPTKYVQFANKDDTDKPAIYDEASKNEEKDDTKKLQEEKEAATKFDDDVQPKSDDIDNDSIIVDSTSVHSAKKRGRRPAAKLLPKLDVSLDQQQVSTRSSRVKKSPRLNNDESAYSYTLTKKDKSINEQVSLLTIFGCTEFR